MDRRVEIQRLAPPSHIRHNNTPRGGTQTITTPSNHIIPLVFINGIPYMVTEYLSNKDLANLERIDMTRNEPWMPHQHYYIHNEHWYDTQ